MPVKDVLRLRKTGPLVANQVLAWKKKRRERGTVSLVHEESHLKATKNFARALAYQKARAEGLSQEEAKKTALLADSAGVIHDIVRPHTEKKPHGVLGKRAFLTLAKKYPSFFNYTEAEKNIIADAIELHELAYEALNARTAGKSKQARIVAEAVQIADKVFEASGFRVIERRSFFVGKERLKKDLKNFPELYGKNASLQAVAMESCMRLRGINYLADVEKAIQPIAAPLHAVQEKFYLGLLKKLGYSSEMQLLGEMERIKFPKLFDPIKKGSTVLFVDKLKQAIKEESPRVAQIRITPDTAESAAEVVNHFVSSKSPSDAIATFKPRGAQASEWLNGMKSYNEGTPQFLKNTQRQLRLAFKAQA